MRIQTASWRLCTLIMAMIFVSTAVASAQSKAKSNTKAKAKAPPAIAPTIADYRYGTDSERQVLDFYQAKSDKPTPVVLFIHGGGWMGGDKAGYGRTAKTYLDKGISVVAITYRLIPEAMEQKVEPPVKAPLYDAARALQTIRANAQEWNIDPNRIGATGSSAGACSSLWLAFHDDLADPSSDDPIARQSTRLTCAAVVGAQTSLDPVQLREWISNSIYGGHAFGFRAEGRSRAQEFDLLLANRDQVLPWIMEYSPIELATSDDPPIYLSYPRQKNHPYEKVDEPDPTHSAMYGLKLAEKLHDLKVEVVVAYPGYEDDGDHYGSFENFLITKLTEK